MRTWKHPGGLWFCWSFSRARRRLSAWENGQTDGSGDRVVPATDSAPLHRRRPRAPRIEAHLTAHSGRVGLASELTARGASTTEVMLAGNWRTARMVAHYSAGATAERGAVAKYL